MLCNYETVVEALNLGTKLEHIKYGFIHREPKGIWGIDQKGAGSGTTQARLYVFPERESELLHVLTVGTKPTQVADIRHCVRAVEELVASVRSE